MAKQLYEIKDFSGGLNAYADPRDIKDTEFSQNWNIVVDKNGILRVIGSAVHHIDSSNVPNPSFSSGYGLFQFNVDYGYSEIDGNFDYGFEQGTVSSVTSATVFALQDIPSVNTDTDDFYKGMTVFFYSATNNTGLSRVVSGYTASTRTITLAAAVGTITTSDKYMIFRWKSVSFNSNELTTGELDYVTNGGSVGADTTILPLGGSSDYFLVDKIHGADEESVNGGYIRYNGIDEANLKLKSGVEYTLSFECGYKYNWRNIICQGDTSNNYAGWVPWIELYSETVSNNADGVTAKANQGLSLMYDNKWAKKNDFEGTNQNYIANQDKNYVENGDFRDSTNHWQKVGYLSSSDDNMLFGFANALLNRVYGGHVDCGGGFIAIYNSEMYDSSGMPKASIQSDTMALDAGSWYRLNFLYKGMGMFYRVRDITDNKDIIPWTSEGTRLFTDEVDDSEESFEYPFQSSFEGRTTSNYIYFYIPEVTGSGTTRNIILNFAPTKGTLGPHDYFAARSAISGITIRKAYNDLVTMSQNSVLAEHPFLGATNVFSKYSTTFKIPKEYNDVSDWVLKLHAGEWDYHNNATFENYAQSQEVYFNNIRISSNVGDTFTLLSSNRQTESKILLHSFNQSTGGDIWNNFLDYTGTDSQFNTVMQTVCLEFLMVTSIILIQIRCFIIKMDIILRGIILDGNIRIIFTHIHLQYQSNQYLNRI